MIYGINILGFIYNWHKAFVALFLLSVFWGLSFEIRHYFYEWHTKPLLQLKRDLKSSREELKVCENSRAVEVFEVENRSVFDSYREKIEEMENEEFNISTYDNNYDWMYK